MARTEDHKPLVVDWYIDHYEGAPYVAAITRYDEEGLGVTMRWEERGGALVLTSLHVYEAGAEEAISKPRRPIGVDLGALSNSTVALVETTSASPVAAAPAQPHGRGVTMQAIKRRLSLGELEVQARRMLREQIPLPHSTVTDDVSSAPAKPRGRRRASQPSDQLQWAHEYVEAANDRTIVAPRRHLAEKWGLSVNGANERIRALAQDGFLTNPGPGRANRELGPTALALLAAADPARIPRS